MRTTRTLRLPGIRWPSWLGCARIDLLRTSPSDSLRPENLGDYVVDERDESIDYNDAGGPRTAPRHWKGLTS